LDTAAAEAEKKTKATLSAAWLKANPPKAGEMGFSCLPPAAKTACGTMCCGNATPKGNDFSVTTGQLKMVCGSKTTEVFKNALGDEFIFKCGAKHLVASAGAILAAAYLM